MFKKISLLLIISGVFLIESLGQKSIYNKARINVIDENTDFFQKLHLKNNEIAKELSQKLNIDVRRKLADGRVIELKGANEIGEPIFTISESNLQASQTTHTNSLFSGGDLGLKISGSGANTAGRLGVWDGGKVLNTHVEFGNRIQQIDNASATSSHSTHVAGTMVAQGINAIARGMAPAALLKAWDYNNDDAEMSTASKDLVVSNHSYGQIAGWVYNDTRAGNQKWEWYGNTQISNFEDYKFGFYDSQSQNWDKIAYNAPNYLIVKSAGNKGDETGPGISKSDTTKTLEKYYLGSSSDTSNIARSRNDGFDNLPTYSVAKNILTVGAVSIIPNGPNLASEIKISSFSSWGPTDDGRIKPDIVGAGVNLFSTTDVSTNSYAFMSGTSMSSPQIAGSIFLLQELFSQLNNTKLMRSSTLKALVLHTAEDAGRPGPDYTYGWGLLNMQKAAKLLLNKDKTYYLEELTLNQSANYSKKIMANGKDPLVATICWTDPEGTPTSLTASNLNNRTPKLINDLDITISDGKNTYQAWILDPSKPANNATKGDNIRDNVEQVFIPNPVPGREYTIKISHKNTLSKGIQDYALVISGSGGAIYCTSSPISQENTKIEKVTINGNIYNGNTGCTNYTDNTDSKIEISPNQKLDIELTLGTCGVQKDKAYSIFADWNIDGDFDDDGEKLAESMKPSNQNVFKNIIQVPSNINPGGNTRMRIIASETDVFSSCGSYSNGESMDFLISYINPKVDLAISNLTYPDANICSNTSIDNISFQLSNKGTGTILDGEVNIKVFENDNIIIDQNSQIKTQIPGLTNTKITVPINFTFKKNLKYKFVISSNVLNDENSINNLFVTERVVNADALSEGAKVIDCLNNDQITLISSGSGETFWYDGEIGGNLLAIGNKVSVKKPALPHIFYASQNDLQGVLGPKTKKEYAGGSYSGNFGPKPLISTKAAIRLESARLYIGHSGKLIFTVERISDLTPISTVTLDVSATRDSNIGNAANGQQLDDASDPGAIYNLNLDIPEAGDYQISIDYEDGASIFRSNQGVSGFPFTLQNAVTISGSSFSGGVLKEAWYYFYNLKIKSLGCASAKRILAETATGSSLTGSIISNGGTSICPNQSVTLSVKEASSNMLYQWFADSKAISEANTGSLKVAQKGNYYLQISENGICPFISNTINIVAKSPQKPIIAVAGNVLTSSEAETYQWLQSLEPINGANQRVYTALQSGNYSLQAIVEGCSVQSNEVVVTILADEIVQENEDLILFPNPTIDELNIKNIKNGQFKFYIFNQLGQKVVTSEYQANALSIPSVSLKSLPSGQYFIRIEMDKKVFLKKITKL